MSLVCVNFVPLIVAVGDLEDTVRNKDADLGQQRSLVEQLDVDQVRMQVTHCSCLVIMLVVASSCM